MGKPKYDALMSNAKDYTAIIFGLALYAMGFAFFILPHKVVIGGLAGLGSLVLFATNGLIPVAVTQYAVNLLLLGFAFRLVGKVFVLRTIFGATVASLAIGILEQVQNAIGHPLMQETAMSVILGAIICGIGIGLVFIHNGSSGGTDIVAAMVSKVSNQSIGRTMIFCDMTIVTCSIFLPFEGTLAERIEARVPIIVYGLVCTYIIAFMTDMIINTNRQATQFIIFSNKWKEIADRINREAHRGVTVIEGTGWYTKTDVKILMVWCRKIEQITIFRIIKSIDENAFITQSHANGVYGKGFDTMRIKMKKKHEHNEEIPRNEVANTTEESAK